MSYKIKKAKREQHAKKVEKQGMKVIIWLCATLVALAILYMIAIVPSMG